jgi:hypothetical protein
MTGPPVRKHSRQSSWSLRSRNSSSSPASSLEAAAIPDFTSLEQALAQTPLPNVRAHQLKDPAYPGTRRPDDDRAVARHRSGRLNSPVLKASTIPATTPTAKIRRQNRNVYRWTGFAAFQCIPCRAHSRIESPTVIAGNVMWNITLRWR